MASTGLIFMAFSAGRVPAAVPSTRNAATIPTAVPKWSSNPGAPCMGSEAIWSAMARTIVAKHTPAIPAMVVSTTLSESTWAMMSEGFAPMARRIPISLVR